MPPNIAQRQKICQDTIARSADIIKQHNARPDSYFLDQLLPLEPAPPEALSREPSEVSVVNADAFAVARDLLDEHPEAKGSIAVLNLASDAQPGGGWTYTLSKTQEEALCYSSTLYHTLDASHYPWPNTGPGSAAALFSPSVVVFKADLDHDCKELPLDRRFIVSVITAAAPRGPPLLEGPNGEEEFQEPSVLEDLRAKIRLIYRLAAREHKEYLILGAFGCGAYRCPPRAVAREMRDILLTEEFKGHFRKVVFAVYSDLNNGPGNFGVFKDVFASVKV